MSRRPIRYDGTAERALIAEHDADMAAISAAANRIDQHMNRVCYGAILVAVCWIGMPALATVLQGVTP